MPRCFCDFSYLNNYCLFDCPFRDECEEETYWWNYYGYDDYWY